MKINEYTTWKMNTSCLLQTVGQKTEWRKCVRGPVARWRLLCLPAIFQHCTCSMSGLQSYSRIVMSGHGEASNIEH